MSLEYQQAEAEVVSSSGLVEVGGILLFRVGGWSVVGWSGVVGEVVDKAISAFN